MHTVVPLRHRHTEQGPRMADIHQGLPTGMQEQVRYFFSICVALWKKMRYIGIALPVRWSFRPYFGPFVRLSVGLSRKLKVG